MEKNLEKQDSASNCHPGCPRFGIFRAAPGCPHLAVHHPGVGTGTGRWDATAAHLIEVDTSERRLFQGETGGTYQTSTNQPFWAKSSNMFMDFIYLIPPIWVDYAPSPKPQGRWEQPLMRFFLVVTSNPGSAKNFGHCWHHATRSSNHTAKRMDTSQMEYHKH